MTSLRMRAATHAFVPGQPAFQRRHHHRSIAVMVRPPGKPSPRYALAEWHIRRSSLVPRGQRVTTARTIVIDANVSSHHPRLANVLASLMS